MTGTDSPVSMLSFTMHWPVNKIKSHGRIWSLGIITTSPGTKSSLLTVICSEKPLEFTLLTSIKHSNLANYLILLIFDKVE